MSRVLMILSGIWILGSTGCTVMFVARQADSRLGNLNGLADVLGISVGAICVFGGLAVFLLALFIGSRERAATSRRADPAGQSQIDGRP